MSVPYDPKQRRAAGHAFINFASHDTAVDFYRLWHGKHLSNHGASRNQKIRAAEVQGLVENLRYFEVKLRGNKNAMHLPALFNATDMVVAWNQMHQQQNMPACNGSFSFYGYTISTSMTKSVLHMMVGVTAEP